MKITLLSILILTISCGGGEGSELHAIYDSSRYLIRASKTTEKTLLFEVCFISSKKEDASVSVVEGSCTPAFMGKDGKVISFSLFEVQNALSREDVALIEALKQAKADYHYVKDTAGVMTVGAAAGAILGTGMVSVAVFQAAESFVLSQFPRIKGVGVMVPHPLGVSFMTVSLVAMITAVILVGGGAFMAFENMQKGGVDSLRAYYEGLLEESSEEVKLAAAYNYHNLSRAAWHWQSIISTDDSKQSEVGSVFHVLEDMGRYFKNTLAAKNMDQYCFPQKQWRSYRTVCKDL